VSDVIAFSGELRNARATVVDGKLDSGFIDAYDGTRIATPDTAITTQTKLFRVPLDSPAGTVSDGVLTFTLPDAVVGLAGGTATWWIGLKSDGSPVCTGGIGVSGSGESMEIGDTDIIEGGSVTPVSMTITEG